MIVFQLAGNLLAIGSRRRPGSWFSVLALFAVALVINPPACRCQGVPPNAQFSKGQYQDSQRTRLLTGQYQESTGARSQSRLKKSDAEAGVQLLETIIARVMNNPTVALNKSTSQVTLAQNLKKQINSPTDYKLAIRPKESGKTFAAPPNLPLMIAQAPSAYMSQPGDNMYQPKIAAPASGSSPQNEMIYGNESAPATTESWRGSALMRLAPKIEAPAGVSADKPGLWENSRGPQLAYADHDRANYSTRASSAAGALYGARLPNAGYASGGGAGGGGGASYMHENASASAVRGQLMARVQSGSGFQSNMNKYAKAKADAYSDETRKIPDLATAVNKLYKVGKGLEEAQNLVSQAPQPQSPPVERTSKASWRSAPRELQIIDDQPVIKDFREPAAAPAQINLPERKEEKRTGGTLAGAAIDMGTSATGELEAPRKSSLQSRRSKSSPSKKEAMTKDAESSYSSDARASRSDRLALLPPNVATGIPGLNLNLGTTEIQAVQTLAQSGGKIKQQKIRSWTVYSWTKRANDSSDALQLYFRHGLLDAIRIFEPDIISSGFGVSPGDKLQAVKERFGEPAFLLPEPQSDPATRSDSGGKNYIYPISQVGFQLARPAIDLSPQVMSVLIFSVR